MKKISILIIILCVQALNSIASDGIQVAMHHPIKENIITEQEIRTDFHDITIRYPNARVYSLKFALNILIVLGNGHEFPATKLNSIFQKTNYIYATSNETIEIDIADIDLFFEMLADAS